MIRTKTKLMCALGQKRLQLKIHDHRPKRWIVSASALKIQIPEFKLINKESKWKKYKNILFVLATFSSYKYLMTLLYSCLGKREPGVSEKEEKFIPFPTCKWPNKPTKFVGALTKGL